MDFGYIYLRKRHYKYYNAKGYLKFEIKISHQTGETKPQLFVRKKSIALCETYIFVDKKSA